VQRPPTGRLCATIACCRCKRVSETTAGLRQPLLVARTQVVAEKRLRFTTPGQAAATTATAGAYRRRYAVAICNGVLFPTGGLRPRLLVLCQRLPAKSDFCDARTHIHKSGGRQPAVGVSNAIAIADAFVQRPASARRGSGNAVATVFVYRRPTGRLCATIAVLPLQARFSKPRLAYASRSWLHARRSLQKSGCDLQHRAKQQQQQPPQAHIVADMRLRFATAFCFPRGAYAPRSCCRANVCRRKNDFCDARTHIHKSGGREPAVGVSNAVAIADAFVQRPALARRWSETTFATANALDFRVSGSHTENIPRGANAPRSWCTTCPVGEEDARIFAMR
jgi:hypothetical protein